MPVFLPFDETYRYKDDEDGIIIPVSLTNGRVIVNTFAAVDTGAAVCLFSRETGEMLGLDIEQGEFKRLGGLTGTLKSLRRLHDTSKGGAATISTRPLHC